MFWSWRNWCWWWLVASSHAVQGSLVIFRSGSQMFLTVVPEFVRSTFPSYCQKPGPIPCPKRQVSGSCASYTWIALYIQVLPRARENECTVMLPSSVLSDMNRLRYWVDLTHVLRKPCRSGRLKPLGALSRRNAGSVVGRRTKKTGATGMRKRKLHWASNAEHVAMRLLDSHHESAGVHLVSNFGQFHFRFVVLHLEHGMQMDACHFACALTLNLSWIVALATHPASLFVPALLSFLCRKVQVLMDRGVEGVSRGMRCQSDLEAAQEGRPFEGRDQESPSLCKTLCVWNPFLACNPVKFPGIFIRL